jgi:hypothetical protein
MIERNVNYELTLTCQFVMFSIDWETRTISKSETINGSHLNSPANLRHPFEAQVSYLPTEIFEAQSSAASLPAGS